LTRKTGFPTFGCLGFVLTLSPDGALFLVGVFFAVFLALLGDLVFVAVPGLFFTFSSLYTLLLAILSW